MDRTLVRIDTATLYVRYRRDKGEATFRDALRVAWWMLQYSFGVIDAERLAREQGFSLSDATFYSDSITDLPLLEHVGTPIIVNPDTRLRRVARSRGWRVESW